MSDDIIRKKENMHQRVDGSGVPPTIRNVVGAGSEYQQGWKTGNGPNWMGIVGAEESNALNEAFFKRRR